MGGDYRPGSSSGRKTQGDHGQETKAAHSPSGSPLAAGLSQDAPLEQTRDPGAARPHDGRAFRFVLSGYESISGRPKNHDAKPGGGRLWKSRSVEKSNKRTFPLRLEIRTHRGFPLYAQPRLLLENRNARPRQKGTFLLSETRDISIVR